MCVSLDWCLEIEAYDVYPLKGRYACQRKKQSIHATVFGLRSQLIDLLLFLSESWSICSLPHYRYSRSAYGSGLKPFLRFCSHFELFLTENLQAIESHQHLDTDVDWIRYPMFPLIQALLSSDEPVYSELSLGVICLCQ